MDNYANTVQTVMAEGRYAFRVGEPVEDNPYPPDHAYWVAWLEGWRAAHTQYNGKPTIQSEKKP